MTTSVSVYDKLTGNNYVYPCGVHQLMTPSGDRTLARDVFAPPLLSLLLLLLLLLMQLNLLNTVSKPALHRVV